MAPLPTKGRTFLCALLSGLLAPLCHTTATAQDTHDDEDIWRSVELGQVDYEKEKNHCLRIYGYYRFVDDGISYFHNREFKLYRIYEGICELDVRYNKNWDDGAVIIAARNLVHPDRQGKFMDYYELKPYTFLEKARRRPKRYTLQTTGDTTRVYTKRGLAGTAIRDTARHELRMRYNALSPDTAYNVSLVYLSGHLSHMDAEAVYRLDDSETIYVPQGNLKRIVFEGDMDFGMDVGRLSVHDVYHERTELYVDSVAYLTLSQYQADMKKPEKERIGRCGYTEADIDRLKQKHHVPPLTTRQLARMEDQRDWDDMYEHWAKTNNVVRSITKTAEKVADSDAFQSIMEKSTKAAQAWEEKERQKKEEDP